MAISRRSTASGIAGIALAATLLLSGCSADEKLTPVDDGGDAATSSPQPSDSGTQSTEEACGILQDGVEETMNTLEAGDASDPAVAAAAVAAISESFGAAADQIDNAEVRAAADAAGESFLAYGEALEAVSADPAQTESAVAAQTELETALGELGEVCP
jgi:hypothetical protein